MNRIKERNVNHKHRQTGSQIAKGADEYSDAATRIIHTDRETPWTRIIEHKWFEFGVGKDGKELPKTVISREYSSEWKLGDEPYYPLNDETSNALYQENRKLADKEAKIIFGGRLGEYRYYDMDAVIVKALEMWDMAWSRS